MQSFVVYGINISQLIVDIRAALYYMCFNASLITGNFYQKFPADKAYYVAKELLMTERTYKKDLEIVAIVSMIRFMNVLNWF